MGMGDEDPLNTFFVFDQVLVDGASKKKANVWSGYTETNKLVNFTGEHVTAGDIVKVKITACKTFSLDGEQIL